MKSAAAFLSVLLLCACLQPSLGAEESTAPVRLDLDHCVEIAIRNSTLVLKSENDVALSGELLLQSYAQFLPTVDAGAGYNYNWGQRLYTFSGSTLVSSRYWGAQYSLLTSLNLFNGFADYATFRASLRRRDASTFSLTRARQQIATDVTQNYFQIILDHELLDIDQKNFQADQARLQLLTQQAELGSATLADQTRQQAQVSTDQTAVTAATARMRDDELLLIQKLRLDPKQTYDFTVPEFVAPSSPKESEASLIGSALSGRADLKAAEASTDAFRWDVTTARADYLPKLGLTFQLNGNGTYLNQLIVNGTNQLPPSQTGLWTQLGNQIAYAAGITLTWNLLDRGLTRLATARARINADNSEIDLQDRKLQVQTEIRQAYNDLISAQRQLQSAQTTTIAAIRAYQIIQGRYKVGASSFVDLITAQAQLVQAQSAEAQARIALSFQAKLLEFYLGKTPLH